MEGQKRLSSMIVEEYHDAGAARAAREHFETRFQRRENPANVPVFGLTDELWICELMETGEGSIPSTSRPRQPGRPGCRARGRRAGHGCSDFRFRSGRRALLEVGRRRHRQDRAMAATSWC